MFSKQAAMLLVVPLLAACESVDPVSQSHDPGFGETVKYNAAIQTVNPEPVYDVDDAVPGQNGQRAADATKRYRSGQVKAVEGEGTGSVSGGGPQ